MASFALLGPCVGLQECIFNFSLIKLPWCHKEHMAETKGKYGYRWMLLGHEDRDDLPMQVLLGLPKLKFWQQILTTWQVFDTSGGISEDMLPVSIESNGHNFKKKRKSQFSSWELAMSQGWRQSRL